MPSLLELQHLSGFYGESAGVRDVSFSLSDGECLALMGRNGAGKTTTLKAILGMVSRTGQVSFAGTDITSLRPFEIVRLGIAYVPEGRGILARLTVEENLTLVAQGNRDAIREVLAEFPWIQQRLKNRGDQLSGGEQQMLAIARAIAVRPRVALLDEPSEGLAPTIVEQLHRKVAQMKQGGTALVIVGQDIEFSLTLADRLCILEEGRVHYVGAITSQAKAKELVVEALALSTKRSDPADGSSPMRIMEKVDD
ncbi:MAG: ABC transporter ATP-binding protein [Chloroflexi bacterium]|nr:ABC transporter ATP-binding protein [Chloroflexota bacterium]